MKAYAALWFRAFAIVSITACNVVNVSRGHFGLAFVSGGALSCIWWGNTRSAAHSSLVWGRWAYGFGAACGTVAGMAVGRWL